MTRGIRKRLIFREATVAKRSITTEWVLTEVADALASPRTRGSIQLLYQGLRNNPKVTIIPAEHISFELGMDLYCNRSDKGWSLTDCIRSR